MLQPLRLDDYRPQWLPGLAMWAVLLAAAGCGDPLDNASNQKYNVLLITIDTLRADHVGAMGYDQIETPNLDRLASEGILFEHAYTPCPLTLPSHASIMTGTYPTFHGVRNNGIFHANASLDTLAEAFKNHGYSTGAIIAAFVLDASFGLDQGFDLYDDKIETGKKMDSFFSHSERKAREITNRAFAFIKRNRERPFFLWVHYYDPHAAFDPPPRFTAKSPDAPYDGEIAYVDEQIGNLLKMVKMNGLEEDTIVIIASDHGEGPRDHGEEYHGALVYDTTLHVLLLFWNPSLIREPRSIEIPVSLVDLMPTVLDLLNMEPGNDVQGSSLVPLMAGNAEPAHDFIYFETLLPFFDYGWAGLRGIRNAKNKYIAAPVPELYDVRKDPSETTNLYAENAAAAKGLHEAMVRLASRSFAAAEGRAGKAIDDEIQDRLSALGYSSGAAHTALDEDPFIGPDPKSRIWVLRAIEEAITLYHQGRYDEAVRKLEDLVKEEPGNSDILVNLSVINQELGRLKDAERYFKKYLEIRPTDEKALVSLSKVLNGQGRPEEAIEVLEQAMKVYPEHAARMLYNIARIRIDQGKNAKAEECLKRVIVLDPEFSEAHNNLGTIYAGRGDYSGAVEHFKKALAADPAMGDAHLNGAMCYYLLKEYKKALFHADRARRLGVEVDPDFMKNLAPYRK